MSTTGETSSTKKVEILPYKDQNYEKLKQECLNNKTLFEDPLFPACQKSLSYTSYSSSITWKRPHEIVKNNEEPKFIQDGAKASDLDQGELGNCWFIAACAAIFQEPEFFNRVVPPNQPITGSDYAGIFHFRFLLYGKWHDVVIDDRLPVRDDKLVYCKNREEPNEFWAALLEKAYAKIFQCYENLDVGTTTDALIDMTGGIKETFQLKGRQPPKTNEKLWNLLIQSKKYKSLVGCSISPCPGIREAKLNNGLIRGHAYTVTKVALFQRYGKDVGLVRVRNPWGNDAEWRGAWCDNSYEWSTVDEAVKKELGYRSLADGEFWMSFDDFYVNFENIEVCSLNPESFMDEIERKEQHEGLKWKLTQYDGAWIPGKSSGGSSPQTYCTNPQYLVSLKKPNNDEENMSTIIVSLMQKHTREKRIERGGEAAEEFINFRLYKVKNSADVEQVRKNGTRLYANQLEKVGDSGSYLNARDITQRFRVAPGDYILIPSCYDQNVAGEFLLRIFTEVPLNEEDCKALEEHRDNLNDNETNFHTDQNDNSWSKKIKDLPKPKPKPKIDNPNTPKNDNPNKPNDNKPNEEPAKPKTDIPNKPKSIISSYDYFDQFKPKQNHDPFDDFFRNTGGDSVFDSFGSFSSSFYYKRY